MTEAEKKQFTTRNILDKGKEQMKSRFIVKPMKIVWRNSMIAGNPIVRSFQKFGVFDRNWENDRFCCCPRPGGEWATNNGQSYKYRIVVDDADKAKQIANVMNSLAIAIDGYNSQIEFGVQTSFGIKCISKYISNDDINRIIVTRSLRKS